MIIYDMQGGIKMCERLIEKKVAAVIGACGGLGQEFSRAPGQAVSSVVLANINAEAASAAA